jgi:hypothetical protein
VEAAGKSSEDGVLLRALVGWGEVHETLDENLLGLRSEPMMMALLGVDAPIVGPLVTSLDDPKYY